MPSRGNLALKLDLQRKETLGRRADGEKINIYYLKNQINKNKHNKIVTGIIKLKKSKRMLRIIPGLLATLFKDSSTHN